MFVKVTNGTPQYYTLGQLRRDNPRTSFPRSIPEDVLAVYDVYPLAASAAPDIDHLTEFSTESVAQVDGVWSQIWTVAQLPVDAASSQVRGHRNELLSSTDWMALSDSTLTQEWALYRQALRDITSQAGFPYDVEWPAKPGE